MESKFLEQAGKLNSLVEEFQGRCQRNTVALELLQQTVQNIAVIMRDIGGEITEIDIHPEAKCSMVEVKACTFAVEQQTMKPFLQIVKCMVHMDVAQQDDEVVVRFLLDNIWEAV